MSQSSRGGIISVFKENPHIAFLMSSLALLLVGLVMVYSAGSIDAVVVNSENPLKIVAKQLLYIALGSAIAFLVVAKMPYYVWRGVWLYLGWGIVFLGLLLTMVPGLGVEANGAQRWLDLKFIQLQMSEFAKVILLLVAADIMMRVRNDDIVFSRLVFECLCLVLLPMLIIFKAQSDLGTTLLIGVSIMAVIWFGDGKTRWIAGMVAAAVVLVAVASLFGGDYRASRWVFLDPWDDGQNGMGAGYQLTRSIYAFARGGLIGSGLGNSHEKYQYLFGCDTDFIYSIIGEEWGFVGAVLVIALFLALLWSGLRIAMSSYSVHGRIVAGSATTLLVAQAFLNIGCAICMLPTTGKPLPFISSGGSSLLSTLILVGLILSVHYAQSGQRADETAQRRRADLRIVRPARAYDSDGSYRR